MEENKKVEDFRETEEEMNEIVETKEKKGFLTKAKAVGSKIMNIKVKDVVIVGLAAAAIVGGVIFVVGTVANKTSEETTDDTTNNNDDNVITE